MLLLGTAFLCLVSVSRYFLNRLFPKQETMPQPEAHPEEGVRVLVGTLGYSRETDFPPSAECGAEAAEPLEESVKVLKTK